MSDTVAKTPNLGAITFSGNNITYGTGKAEDIDTTLSQIGGLFDDSQNKLSAALIAGMTAIGNDPSNPVTLAKYQEVSASYTGLMNSRSSMIKSFRDLYEQILRNV